MHVAPSLTAILSQRRSAMSLMAAYTIESTAANTNAKNCQLCAPRVTSAETAISALTRSLPSPRRAMALRFLYRLDVNQKPLAIACEEPTEILGIGHACVQRLVV